MTKEIACPQCKKKTEFSPSNEFRPFCSERCKLLDLGDWADEKYAIASEEPPGISEYDEE